MSNGTAKRQEQRYFQKIGENLQTIVKELLKNQTLLRYLCYTDMEPLSPNKPNINPKDVLHEQIRMIPVIGNKEEATSIVTVRLLEAAVQVENPEFIEVYLDLEIFVPNTQWILKADNLRPYLIMGEINRSLNMKKINGLGDIVFDLAKINFITEELTCYKMVFHITQFN